MEFSQLVAALNSADAAQRGRAAEALSHLGPESRDAALPLVLAVGDQDETVREWSAAALEELGSPRPADVPALGHLVEHPHADVAYWAVTLLGRLGAEAAGATSQLAAALSAPAPLAVRQRAAWALAQIGPPAAAAVAALNEASAADDPRLARLARQALGKIQEMEP